MSVDTSTSGTAHPHDAATEGAHGDPAWQHLQRRRIWDEKYQIRACYRSWYERMRPHIAPGQSVEVGAGSGHLNSLWPELMCTDLVPTPFVAFASDAMRLPFAGGSIGNLVVVDLLHHVRDPHLFFDEAARVLRPGGRVIAMEPYITPVSYVGYRLLHHEDVYFGGYHRSAVKDDPWEGNLALPNLLFGRELRQWPARHPSLRIIHRRCFGMLDFQLAGGFKPYAFVRSHKWYDRFLALDQKLDVLGRLLGFRVFVVIEKL